MVNEIRWIHSAITGGGKAMHTVQNRFISVLGPGRGSWDEEEHIKKVSSRDHCSEASKH
jgi:hypothetical protein